MNCSTLKCESLPWLQDLLVLLLLLGRPAPRLTVVCLEVFGFLSNFVLVIVE